MNSPNSFSDKNALKVLKKETKTVWFFDFGDPKYMRWFEVSGVHLQAGLIEKGHIEGRIKDMLEKEHYTE